MKPAFSKLIPLLPSAVFILPAYADNEFVSQHRIGIGFNDTNIYDTYTAHYVDWGKGIKLEYGREFNQIVGINVSYAKNKDSETYAGITSKIDGNKFQVDTDIGYKFLLEDFSIKPYGAIGIAYQNEKNSVSGWSDESYSDTSLIIGLGARAEFWGALYSDLRFDFGHFHGDEYDNFSLSVGYRF